MNAEAGAVFDAALSEVGDDALVSYLVPVGVVVIGAVGVQAVGSLAWAPSFASYRWDGFDQREQLGDVVTVAAGQCDGKRDARAVGDEVVFRAGLGAVDRARAGCGPPLSART